MPAIAASGVSAEHGDVRARGAVDEQQDRDADADEQAGQRAEDQHADERGDRGDEVGARRHGVDAAGAADVKAVQAHERGTSTSSITAAMTIAASVASGRSSKSPVRKSSVTIASTATTSPESCERAPAELLTAVLDRLPPTTIPLDSPEATLAAPRPSSSRLASIS